MSDHQRRSRSSERVNAYGTSKEQILKAAEALFSKQGFNSTTLKDVARESGANTALVGYHFGGKEGLRQAVIESLLARAEASMGSTFDSSQPVTEQTVHEMISRLLILGRDEKSYYRCLIWSMVDGGDQAALISNKMIRPLQERIIKTLSLVHVNEPVHELEARAMCILGILNHFINMRWHYYEYLLKDAFQAEPNSALDSYLRFCHHQMAHVALGKSLSDIKLSLTEILPYRS